MGRLLYVGHDDWVHINCALWSAEVYEEVDGTLQNVHAAIGRARTLVCNFQPFGSIGRLVNAQFIINIFIYSNFIIVFFFNSFLVHGM